MSLPGTSAQAETWVWNASVGVYYHAASNMYALPSDGEWTYLTPYQLGQQGIAADKRTAGREGSSGRQRNDHGEAYDNQRADTSAKEDGEVEDDVGWGGLMDPEELARVVEKGRRGNGKRWESIEAEQRDSGSSRHSPWTGTDAGDRHPAYSNGYEGDSPHLGMWPSKDTADNADSSTPPVAAQSDSRTDEPGISFPDPSSHLLRLVVRRSKELETASVAVLDAREGGIQIGRDRCDPGATARIRVREMEVSKTHALVYWGRSGGLRSTAKDSNGDATADVEGWWIVDLGSTLGTYVAHRGERDATRLSDPKCSSKPYPIRHGSVITVGTTTFTSHVHDDWPCKECQLAGNTQLPLDDGTRGKPVEEDSTPPQHVGSSRVAVNAGQRRGELQLKRKMEMAALRDNLLGKSDTRSGPEGTYMDRSAQRRRIRPSSPPRSSAPPERSAAVVAAPAKPAGPSIVSQAMLAKHGWAPGQGLGRDGGGRAEAILPVLRNARVGLGGRGERAESDTDGRDGGWKERGKRRRWEEAGK